MERNDVLKSRWPTARLGREGRRLGAGTHPARGGAGRVRPGAVLRGARWASC